MHWLSSPLVTSILESGISTKELIGAACPLNDFSMEPLRGSIKNISPRVDAANMTFGRLEENCRRVKPPYTVGSTVNLIEQLTSLRSYMLILLSIPADAAI